MTPPKIAADPGCAGAQSSVATTPVDERQSLADSSTGARPKYLNLHFEWLVAVVILGAMVGAQWLFVSCNGGI